MTTEQDQALEGYARALEQSQLNTNAVKISQQQQDMYVENVERSLAAEQLDLSEIIGNMENLLRGFELKDGKWIKPTNNDMIVLSEYGVSYFMWMLNAYLTKNTLLSNYSEEQIYIKMQDFSTVVADDVFMEYDKMFLYPTLDDCKDEIKKRIKAKVDIKMFANELIGKNVLESEIEQVLIHEMEDRIERELETIRQQKVKNKLKRFESLLRIVQDTVHSAYMRAWKGQERITIRQHHHISENKGQVNVPGSSSAGSFNPLNMFRRQR